MLLWCGLVFLCWPLLTSFIVVCKQADMKLSKEMINGIVRANIKTGQKTTKTDIVQYWRWRGGDCCHLFSKWWLTSRSQTGRQNILKNHDNRGFLLLVMNFQNYLSVTTKRSDSYLFPQKFFMRIPSIIVICMLGVSPNFEITVACGLKFIGYFS